MVSCFSETWIDFHQREIFKLIYTWNSAVAEYNYNNQVKEDEIGRACGHIAWIEEEERI
jgi:hypothetical protein